VIPASQPAPDLNSKFGIRRLDSLGIGGSEIQIPVAPTNMSSTLLRSLDIHPLGARPRVRPQAVVVNVPDRELRALTGLRFQRVVKVCGNAVEGVLPAVDPDQKLVLALTVEKRHAG
jgi:hypothetical protein